MKKTITLFLFIYSIVLDVQAQCTGNVFFPDDNFKRVLIEEHNIDTNSDGEISCEEAYNYRETIDVQGRFISDLTGIEAFVNITELYCGNNNLTELHLEEKFFLRILECSENNLTDLHLFNTPNLEALLCYNNNLNYLEISEDMPNLSFLECSENDLDHIDVYNAPNLEHLLCRNNNLDFLELSGVHNLRFLDCSENNLVELDVSTNSFLDALICESNELIILNIANGNNRNIGDVTANNNPNLICVQVDDVTYSSENWLKFDETASFSTDCNQTFTLTTTATNGIIEISPNKESFFLGEIIQLIAIPDNEYEFIGWSGEVEDTQDTENPLRILIDSDKDITANFIGTCVVNIPDANFKAALIANTSINTNGDLEISCEEAINYTGTISVNNKSIEDLTGIEAFVNLESLLCRENNLSTLDLSANTKLQQLWCNNNILTSMDISKCLELNSLFCQENKLTNLDLSNHSNLWEFSCYSNELTNLNIANGNNEDIFIFEAAYNPNLTCIQVDDVAYSEEEWTFVDETTSFSTDCSSISLCIGNINIPDANFKAALIANASINTDGDSEISCEEATAFTGEINITHKQVSDVTGIEAFVNLTVFNCTYNSIAILDMSANKVLESLDCSINNIVSLNVSKNIFLKELRAFNNQLESISISTNLDLETLNCSNNTKISNLDVSNNTKLKHLSFFNNGLTTIDLSKNLNLETLTCFNNFLTSLDLSSASSFTSLTSYSNELINLNIANGNNVNVYATGFSVNDNPNLTCIQVDDVTYSEENWVSYDETVSFSTNCSDCYVNIPDANFKTALIENTSINTDGDTEVSCEEAEAYTGRVDVRSLLISDLTGIEAFVNIEDLRCQNNNLTRLDLSANTALVSLRCQNNDLTSLNIANGNNMAFTRLQANNNSDLTCIQVDYDADFNAIEDIARVDNTVSFSENCNTNFTQKTSNLANQLKVNNNSISVYPNPVISTLNIRLQANEELEQVKVYNLLGEEIITSKEKTIDVNSLTSGIYLLKVRSMNGEVTIRKVIKK